MSSFPFPLSDNRSYLGEDQVQFGPDPAYSHGHYLSRHPSYEADARIRITAFHAESAALDLYHQAQSAFRMSLGGHHDFPSASGQTPYAHSHDALPAQSPVNLSPIDASAFAMPFGRDAYSCEITPGASSSLSQSPPESAPQQSAISSKRTVSLPVASSSKARREKPRIELAPDQPLTTQGKPRTRVYVACIQCRSRKIRCDGAKPHCHNCSRRPDSSTQCSYDSVPKRRGPDKTPGARQRTVGGDQDGDRPRRRTRRRAEENSTQTAGGNSPQDHHADSTLPSVGFAPGFLSPDGAREYLYNGVTSGERTRDSSPSSPHPSYNSSFSSPDNSTLNSPLEPPSGDALVSQVAGRYEAYGTSAYDNYGISAYAQSYFPQAGHPPVANGCGDCHNRSELSLTIPTEPSVRFARQTWWDTLLSVYSSYDGAFSRLVPVPATSRELISQRIVADLRFLFRCSSYWMSFVNISRFFARLRDSASRSTVQPSLILAALALVTFLRSSEEEQGARGRDRALRLRDEAQSALEASVNARWIDETLVQASWMLAYFEVSAHPLHSPERVRSSVSMLDSLVRSLSLTQLDAGDERVSKFAPHAVPTVPQPTDTDVRRRDCRATHGSQAPPRKCACVMRTLGETSPRSVEATPLWSATPAWSGDLSEREVQREECRRLVWSTVMLVAGYSSYATAMETGPMVGLFVMDPANYAVLFPGESLDATEARKDSVWALYMRALLLWNSYVRMRQEASTSYLERAHFAIDAWLEIEAIEEALRRHTCNIERTFTFASREYLSNARMFIYDEIKQYVPQATANANIVHRRKAEEWLTHQASVAKTAMLGLHMVTGQPTSSLSGRPSHVFWFIAQISRILKLWSNDNTLVVALDAAIALLALLEQLTALWPCPEPQRKTQELRGRITAFCCASGVIPPPD